MVEISCSVLDVEEENSVKTFYNLETAKIDYFHIDVMDGKFVKKNTSKKMRDYALKISHISNIPLDVHLMCSDVRKYIDDYIDLKPDRITFHIEAVSDKEEAIELIKYLQQNEIKACMAIKPGTELENIYEILPYLHMVLVMTVEPGLGGQKIIPEMIDRVKVLKKYCDEKSLDIDIEVDGGVNDINSTELANNGANIIVSGNYIINSENYNESVKKLKS
ncbi:MAG: ribulose-phosphate 3-epimerase [Clostridia bacterium]|nr:ribulose-phosphate 3-epimerase [Clostridia bacterium]